MSFFLLLFLIPFCWAILTLVHGSLVPTITDSWRNAGKTEANGLGLVFLGSGSIFFGYEFCHAFGIWRRERSRYKNLD